MNTSEITRAHAGAVPRGGRRLGRRPAAPASLRAQIVLTASALLLGGVLGALLFVGVWRRTAAEGDRARAAQAQSTQVLQTARAKLTRSEAESRALGTQLAKLRTENGALAAELAKLRRVDTRVATSLPPRLQAIGDEADALTRELAKLRSALATLSDYLQNASATGVDPAFLDAQVRYLIGSTAATRTTVANLVVQAQRARASAAALHH
ncbi:MAG TPA: hypothetical protein VMS63_08860 [Gaiellaceae bacterium]|nr:hypothetical protein [Gaiellaceae bacterium]